MNRLHFLSSMGKFKQRENQVKIYKVWARRKLNAYERQKVRVHERVCFIFVSIGLFCFAIVLFGFVTICFVHSS